MIQEVSAPADADVEDVKAYARHVQGCATCKAANLDDELCHEGGALWDAVCFGADDSEEIFAPCVICGERTSLCCVDCGIDNAGKNIPHVCAAGDCRDKHEVTVHGRGKPPSGRARGL